MTKSNFIHSCFAKIRQRLPAAIMIVGAVLSLLPSNAVIAQTSTNRLTISPGSSQMNINTTFTVNVRSYAVDPQAVGTASGSITYPTNLLRVQSVSTSGSQYGTPQVSLGNGIINFNASVSNAKSGFAQVFTINFTAIGAGTATTNFSGDSKVNNGTTAYSNGAFTIINPNPPSTAPSSPPKAPTTPKPSVVTPAPVVIETPAPTPEPSTEENPQPTPDPTGLIDSVVVDPFYDSGAITWKVNTGNAKSTLVYGSKSTSLDKMATVTKKEDGSFTTSIKELVPGTRYYFAINGSGDGGKNGTYSGTIITRGFPIVMTITENNIAVKNAQVKIGNRSYSTTSNGKLSIGLAVGNYKVTIVTDTSVLNGDLTVEKKDIPADGTAPPSQAFAFNLTSAPTSGAPGSQFSILAFIGMLLGGTVVLGLGFVAFMAYRRRKFEGGDYSAQPVSTVIIDDGYDWHKESDTTPNMNTQATSQPPVGQSSPAPIPRHNNSVYLDEEEPLDMFDRSNNPTLPNHHSQNP